MLSYFSSKQIFICLVSLRIKAKKHRLFPFHHRWSLSAPSTHSPPKQRLNGGQPVFIEQLVLLIDQWESIIRSQLILPACSLHGKSCPHKSVAFLWNDTVGQVFFLLHTHFDNIWLTNAGDSYSRTDEVSALKPSQGLKVSGVTAYSLNVLELHAGWWWPQSLKNFSLHELPIQPTVKYRPISRVQYTNSYNVISLFITQSQTRLEMHWNTRFNGALWRAAYHFIFSPISLLSSGYLQQQKRISTDQRKPQLYQRQAYQTPQL